MDYILNRDDFSIMFYDINFYKSDIKIDAPILGTIRISIKSDKYAAKSYLDVSHKDFISFFNNIVDLWNSLKSGKSIIKEPYGYEQYIEFICSNGKFMIKGKLLDVDFHNFRIEFEELVDQSYMNDFIQSISSFEIENHLK